MRKFFKQLLSANVDTNNFQYVNNVHGRNGLVFNFDFYLSSPLEVSIAYIEVTGLSQASYMSFYWDKAGAMTDYSHLDGAEKLDFSVTSGGVMRFDITKAMAALIKEGNQNKTQQYMLTGINIPTNGVSCSVSVYYEYKMGLKGNQATIPLELSTANGLVNLADGSVSLSYLANNGFGRVPAVVKFVYDSKMISTGGDVYFDNSTKGKIEYNCGCGWKMNFQQYIIFETADDSFLTDGESVGYLTWVNAQGAQILFKERLYAVVNGKRIYLTWSQVTINEDDTFSCRISGVVYEVTREYVCDELYTMENGGNDITIVDITGNKTIFSNCSLFGYDNVSTFRLTKVQDSYGNALNISYDNSGKISLISSVGGNAVYVKYGEDGFISQIDNKVSEEKTITTTILRSGELINGFSTTENNGDLTVTYDNNKNIQTVLDPIGNGYNLVVSSGKVSAIIMIAKNGGIENETIIPFKNTNKTITIDGVKYKYINLYEIAYADRYAKLIEKRNNKNSIYLFDYFGRNINTYSNNYDGEGSGNPQSETFSVNQPNVSINSQNVFESSDLTLFATCNRNYYGDITTVSTPSERFAMSEFVTKMNALKSQNKAVNTNVYYSFDDKEIDYNEPYALRQVSIDFTLDNNAVSSIKNGQSLNYVLSAWAMAKSFPLIEQADGYKITLDSEYASRYNISAGNSSFYEGLGTFRYSRKFELYAKVEYEKTFDYFTASFDYDNPNFQQLQIPIRIRKLDKSLIKSITVGLKYDNNNERVYLYGLSMKSCNWTFEQLSDKQLVLYSTNKEKEDYFTEYNYYSDYLLKCVDTTQMSSCDSEVSGSNNLINYKVDYIYNSHNSLLKSVDSKDFVVENIYNGYGDLANKKSYRQLENGDITDSFEEKAEYANSTGFITKDYNSIGQLANTYTYENGVLKTITPADSATISYNYDTALNLITQMTAQVPNNPITTNQNYLKGENIAQSDSGVNVRYDYDGFGRIIKIYLDNEEYCTIEYVNERQKIVTYANGEREKINMNKDDTHADIYQTDNPNNWGSTTVEMTFSKYGGFKQLEDNISGTKIKAEYDDRGLPAKMAVENKDDSFYDVIIKNEYDQTGRVTTRTYEQQNQDTDVANYTYQDEYDGKVTCITHTYIEPEHIYYDDLQRVSKYYSYENKIEYTYKNGDNNLTSDLISAEKYIPSNERIYEYNYEYDNLGRLTEVKHNGIITKRYSYDLVGRLIREDNRDFNKTFEFIYDKAGNILKRNEYTYNEGVLPVNPVATFNYTYDTTHKNRLLSYNGEQCNNYVLGNPRIYRGKTAVWTKVHRLASLGNVSFEYDYAGIRTKKTVNGVTIKYGINGSTIVSEQKGADATTRINYYYGYNGLVGFKYQGRCYYYEKNFLGDIIAVYDEGDNLVVKYAYDAWGNHKVLNPDGTENTNSSFIGNINPYRYRSYYFDIETGLYYLQSRYYDPEVGRFISMDQVEYLAPDVVNGLNLYAYCLNNPVMSSDPEGTWLRALIGAAVGAIAGAVGQFVSDVTTSIVTGNPLKLSSWESYAGAAIGGAAGGMVYATTGNKTLADATIGFTTTASTMLLTNATGKTDYSLNEIWVTSVIDGGVSAGLGKLFPRSTDPTLISSTIKQSFSDQVKDSVIDGLALDVFYGVKSPIFNDVRETMKHSVFGYIINQIIESTTWGGLFA